MSEQELIGLLEDLASARDEVREEDPIKVEILGRFDALRADLSATAENRDHFKNIANNLGADLAAAQAEITRLREVDDTYIEILTEVIKQLGPILPYNKLIAANEAFEKARAALKEAS